MQSDSSKQPAIENIVEPQPGTSQSSVSVRPYRRTTQKLFDGHSNESLGKQDLDNSSLEIG